MLDKDDESDLLDMLDVIAKRPEFKFVKSFATMRQLPDESSETISESNGLILSSCREEILFISLHLFVPNSHDISLQVWQLCGARLSPGGTRSCRTSART